MGCDVIAYATADHHVPEELEAPTWRDVPGVRGDALHALSRVVGLCVADRVPLLAAGDLVDGPDVTPDALAAWFETLRPLTEADLPLLYVCGNHERGRDWLSALGPKAVRLDHRVVTLPSGHTVSGVSYTPPANLPAALAAVTRVTDIGLYHQAVADFGVKGVPASAFPAHLLAIIGDTHVRSAVQPASGPRTVLSPGPLAPQSVAEFGPPGIWAVHADLTVRLVKIRSRAYHRFDVATPADADACVAAVARLVPDDKLPESLARPMVAVRLVSDLDGFIPAVRELCARRDLPLRVLDAVTHGPAGPEVPVAAPRVVADLPGVIAGWPGLSPGARKLALTLADPGVDPAEVLAADRAAWAADPDEADQLPNDSEY